MLEQGDEDGAANWLTAMGASSRAASSFVREPPVCWVFPENWPALRLMDAMSTQWRTGYAGLVGLDYGALPIVEARLGITDDERQEAFAALRVMELEILEALAERAEA